MVGRSTTKKALLANLALGTILLFVTSCGAPADPLLSIKTKDISEHETATDTVRCEPSCEEKECGPDGCAGSCGECGDGFECQEGKCLETAECIIGEPCDDNDPCTRDDLCSEDGCTGTLYQCDDGKECTENICDGMGDCITKILPGSCYINGVCSLDGDPRPGNLCMECMPSVTKSDWSNDDTNECDDEDLCTTDDYCMDGGCVPGSTMLECEDENPCTADDCDPVTGCIFTNLDDACDDGDACTESDACVDGECLGQQLDCDDDNECTSDSCAPETGCIFEVTEGFCDDGDLCTMDDYCEGGTCESGFTEMECDDGNVCTTDSCDFNVGCLNEANSLACDDGNACTVGDVCEDSVCLAGPEQLTCESINVCMSASCVPTEGCVNTPVDGDCDDQNDCTMDDHCESGNCVSGEQLMDCNDSDPCTNDFCDPVNGCFYQFNSEPCSDDNECTEADTCTDGSCLGQVIICNDTNPCTDDTCNPSHPGGCVFSANDSPCDDGSKCTLGDGCVDGDCVAGAGALYCDDSKQCTADSCDPEVGCVHTNLEGDCDDGNQCTAGDFCQSSDCQTGPDAVDCDDGNICTNDVCNPTEGCLHSNNALDCNDGNECTLGDKCSGSKCVPGQQGPDCEDGNLCTSDLCDPAVGCINSPTNDLCDDGNICTDGDYCAGGKCLAGADQEDCDDGDDCTDDTCHPEFGCLNLFNESPCNDGDECTEKDFCVFGECLGQTKTCNDAEICTDDSCDSNQPGGCIYTPNNVACDDADPCSLGDTCIGGTCMSGLGELECDDSNPCTDNVCTSMLGCEYPPIIAFCDDNEICTVDDYCSNGECLSGQNVCECKITPDCEELEDGNLCNGSLVCNASDPNPANWECVVDPVTIVVCDDSADTECELAQCKAGTGNCIMVPVNENGNCDDESVCTTVDHCLGGACVGAELLDCNDDKECTDDYCHPSDGCQTSQVDNETPCGQVGYACLGGECLPCTPACDNKECGSDGCGGSCGSCSDDEVCNQEGLCVPNCEECAPWQDCVDGVCEDPPSMGNCPNGGAMLSADCQGAPTDGCCSGEDGQDLYYCGYWWDCPGIYEYCLCHVECASWSVCSYDSWGDDFSCLFPPAKSDPQGNLFCDWWPCEPDCAGKECGSDGCGGSCGDCPNNFDCENGVCEYQKLETCNGSQTPSYDSCEGLTYYGCCDSDGRLLYCSGGELYCIDCAGVSPHCGYDWDAEWYDCGTSGGSGPDWDKACPACIPKCPVGYSCIAGECVN
jgi:hypothetical protein